MIVNPKSGSNLRVDRIKDLKEHLESIGDIVDIHLTRSLNHASELTKAAVEGNYDTVMIAGGDGSVRVVLEAAAGSRVPVLIIPSGTENLLACELGLDGTLANSIAAVDHGVVREIDLGKVNGKHFMAVIGVGFDAQVVKYVHQKRNGHITPMNYLWPLARTFWSYKFHPIKVVADGRQICDDPALVFVSNIERYAIGLGIAPGADCSDGYLDITIFKCKSRCRLLWQSCLTSLRMDHKSSQVIRLKCQNVEISCNHSVPVQLDGDDGPELPLNISVDPAYAHILTPPPPPGQEFHPPVSFYHIKRWVFR